jgi:hypothetical protein
VSWLAKIRDTAILGAVVTTGVVAGVVLLACSARGRKDASPLPVPSARDAEAATDASVAPPDAERTVVVDAAAGRPDARRVRREQPLPRNYVE